STFKTYRNLTFITFRRALHSPTREKTPMLVSLQSKSEISGGLRTISATKTVSSILVARPLSLFIPIATFAFRAYRGTFRSVPRQPFVLASGTSISPNLNHFCVFRLHKLIIPQLGSYFK